VVPATRSARPPAPDLPGIALSVAGPFLITYGIIRAGERGSLAAPEVWLALLGGVAVLLAFAIVELRSPAPAVDLRSFADRRSGAAVAFLGLMGVVFALLLHLRTVRGLSPLRAAALGMPIAVAQLLFAPRAGAIAQRFGARATVTTGLLVIAARFGGYALLGRDMSLWWLEAVLFVHGAALAVVVPAVTGFMMAAAPPDRPGAGSARHRRRRGPRQPRRLRPSGAGRRPIHTGPLRAPICSPARFARLRGAVMFRWLGQFVVRRRWFVIAGWLAATAAAVAFLPALSTIVSPDQASFLPRGDEAVRADALARDAFPERPKSGALAVFRRTDGAPLSPADVQRVNQTVAPSRRRRSRDSSRPPPTSRRCRRTGRSSRPGSPWTRGCTTSAPARPGPRTGQGHRSVRRLHR
jgi:hypothetical protein